VATTGYPSGLDTPREPGLESRALPLLSEQLFRETLFRERRRAERADRAVGLLLVTLERRDHGSADAWRALVVAISPVMRDTDVVGWFDKRHTLGIIVPADARQHFDATTTDLFRTLAAQAGRGFSIQLRVHPTPDRSNQAAAAIDPFLPPTLSEMRPRPYDAVKRVLDLALSAMFLILLSPLFVIVAALVKLTSRGPVLFKQQRVGLMMQPFVMLKFRTMEVNAAPAIHQEFVSAFITAGQNEGKTDPNRLFKIVKDPRVTSIGHFLRRTSLDELPQFWNVLRGDMSLVGPRPPLPYEVAQYKMWHTRRIGGTRPGLTGLWQVKGRSRTTFDEMVRLDLQYVMTRSFRTDLRILLATPRAVISGKGAC
jgi:lipopolysaccharide/colanic/teichoic acid biosynthesis glycosyltransferase